MQTNSQYKNLAVQALSGNWGKAAIATFIYYFIIGLFSITPAFTLSNPDSVFSAGDGISNVIAILLLPLAWGLTIFFLNIYRGNNPQYGELFDGFRMGYGKFLGTLFLQGVYTVLWGLLLIVPGIIKGYSYSMTSYVMRDDPTLQYNDAINRSMELMEGHKLQLFLLDLSMIGWVILSCMSFGIGFLFLIPYNQTAHAAFYEDLLKGQVIQDNLL